MPAKSHNQSVGKKGEIIAESYLKNKGYEILARNYRAGRGEIDLIVKIDVTLVFVEVKTRTNQNFGFPEEAVNQKKINKLIETAEAYLIESDWEQEIRFDIISIDLNDTEGVTHFEDAFH